LNIIKINIRLASLQALNDGQHESAGTGAGVPSGQILRSIVQKVVRQFLIAIIENSYKLS
jgi:hypothetical protein